MSAGILWLYAGLLFASEPARAASVTVSAVDCFGESRDVERLLPPLLAGRAAGEIRVRCFRHDLAWSDNPSVLVEVDAELTTGSETRRWRGAEIVPLPQRRRRLAELAANLVALAMSRDPHGQGDLEPPQIDGNGRRRLWVTVQASNQLAGGCEHALAILGQLYKTQIISHHFRVEIARCELVDESAMTTLAQAVGRAAQALDLRTDFVLQLSAGPVWGTSESVLGATQLLGRIPFATLSARPPLKVDRMARVIAHEIGHLVGLPHIDGSDIMLPNYREHGDFNVTRALFAAGLHRWLRRPWMREQHFFDDPCRFIAAWEKLAQGGFVVASRMESHRLATRLLVAPDSASTPCCARMLSAACAQGVEVACHTHAQLRELGWIHAAAAAGTTGGL